MSLNSKSFFVDLRLTGVSLKAKSFFESFRLIGVTLLTSVFVLDLFFHFFSSVKGSPESKDWELWGKDCICDWLKSPSNPTDRFLFLPSSSDLVDFVAYCLRASPSFLVRSSFWLFLGLRVSCPCTPSSFCCFGLSSLIVIDFLALSAGICFYYCNLSDSSLDKSMFISEMSSDDRGLFSDSVCSVLLRPAVL